ncbi:hypothetical protein [uncultured Jannaschia sp.]|uniref:hypothetical protein n=1 Tax=uncultured Jannaschia sp. TaxID=293347 RepID=UPI0026289442|nr:hypothetical protein [uncultured Jannaschia sp.]
MSKEWIIDVLGDLRSFAQTNAMPCLADQLDEAIMVAAIEIAQTPAMYAGTDGTQTRKFARAAG